MTASTRARVRVGRSVTYNPTATEVTANGAGPWLAIIADVLATGACDLIVYAPDPSALGAALASPLITTADADATYGQPEADLINELKADVNTLVARVNQLITGSGALRKSAVAQGTTAGTFSLTGIPNIPV